MLREPERFFIGSKFGAGFAILVSYFIKKGIPAKVDEVFTVKNA